MVLVYSYSDLVTRVMPIHMTVNKRMHSIMSLIKLILEPQLSVSTSHFDILKNQHPLPSRVSQELTMLVIHDLSGLALQHILSYSLPVNRDHHLSLLMQIGHTYNHNIL